MGIWAMSRGIGAMSRGIRAIGRGIRAMTRGIRAMARGIRAMARGIKAIQPAPVKYQSRYFQKGLFKVFNILKVKVKDLNVFVFICQVWLYISKLLSLKLKLDPKDSGLGCVA